jgi:hypothetical protein
VRAGGSLYSILARTRPGGRLPKRLMLYIDPGPWGHVAEWLRNGLQNRAHQFNSGRGLHKINDLATNLVSLQIFVSEKSVKKGPCPVQLTSKKARLTAGRCGRGMAISTRRPCGFVDGFVDATLQATHSPCVRRLTSIGRGLINGRLQGLGQPQQHRAGLFAGLSDLAENRLDLVDIELLTLCPCQGLLARKRVETGVKNVWRPAVMTSALSRKRNFWGQCY